MLGTAALAMWWDIAPDQRADFEDWHAHEHVPERLGLPGFLRATRWSSAAGGEGMFVTYELADHAVLSSPAYVARLNAPTPWSTRLMPHHRHMVRSQCRVVASRGGYVARHALTLRLEVAAAAGGDAALHAFADPLLAELGTRPGFVGVHLLQHEAPAMAPTAEQRIRDLADRAADRILVVCGYDLASLEAFAASELAADRLGAQGLVVQAGPDLFTLSYSALPSDTH